MLNNNFDDFSPTKPKTIPPHLKIALQTQIDEQTSRWTDESCGEWTTFTRQMQYQVQDKEFTRDACSAG